MDQKERRKTRRDVPTSSNKSFLLNEEEMNNYLKNKKDKEAQINKKNKKKLDRGEDEPCQNEKKKHRISTNCCESDNLSKGCNSASGTTKHIFETVYPDLKAALLMATVAGNFAKKAEKIATEDLPKTIFYSPKEAALLNEGRMKALETLSTVIAAQEILGGKKNRTKKSKQNYKKNKNNKKYNKKTLKRKNKKYNKKTLQRKNKKYNKNIKTKK
tara:strand:- start:1293 stop:1937 length:645 start_codon:yes stop_codon:yes gene_type:complete